MTKLLALFAFAVLAGFLGILIWHVPELDLVILTLAVTAMAGYDLVATHLRNKK